MTKSYVYSNNSATETLEINGVDFYLEHDYQDGKDPWYSKFNPIAITVNDYDDQNLALVVKTCQKKIYNDDMISNFLSSKNNLAIFINLQNPNNIKVNTLIKNVGFQENSVNLKEIINQLISNNLIKEEKNLSGIRTNGVKSIIWLL